MRLILLALCLFASTAAAQAPVVKPARPPVIDEKPSLKPLAVADVKRHYMVFPDGRMGLTVDVLFKQQVRDLDSIHVAWRAAQAAAILECGRFQAQCRYGASYLREFASMTGADEKIGADGSIAAVEAGKGDYYATRVSMAMIQNKKPGGNTRVEPAREEDAPVLFVSQRKPPLLASAIPCGCCQCKPKKPAMPKCDCAGVGGEKKCLCCACAKIAELEALSAPPVIPEKHKLRPEPPGGFPPPHETAVTPDAPLLFVSDPAYGKCCEDFGPESRHCPNLARPPEVPEPETLPVPCNCPLSDRCDCDNCKCTGCASGMVHTCFRRHHQQSVSVHIARPRFHVFIGRRCRR